jgi:hypothetical protein
MVKKLSIRIQMKPVIEALREGKKSWSDLKKLKIRVDENEKRSIPDKTLETILKKYLAYWGLARKEGDYWVWYEHSRIFNSVKELELAIEHSRKLLPAFQNMLEVGVLARHPLYSAAKEHLRSYPETYEKLEKFEGVFNERVRELLQKHGHKIRTPNRFMILDPVKVEGKGFFGRVFGETKYKLRDVPYMIDFGHPEIKGINELKKTPEWKEINELRDFLDNTKAFSERFALYGELAGDIAVLCLKIEMGQPLEGTCPLCPKVRIAD